MAIRDTAMETGIVDNHAHPVEPLERDVILNSFSTFFTEGNLSANHARNTINYQVVTDFLKSYFEVEDESAALQARTEVDLQAYSRELISQTGTDIILADDGFPSITPSEFEDYTDADIRPIKRIESVAESLVPEYDDFDAFENAFEAQIRHAMEEDYVGLKSIVAYRKGLNVTRPEREAVNRSYEQTQSNWNGRLDNDTLLDYLAHLAADLASKYDVPIQFHTGFGDQDAHPRYVDPTYLFEFLKEHSDTKVVLLHGGYPYVRNAGYVTATLENVYLDLSLATPFVQHGVEPMIAAALELAPTTKILYGSDAFSVPELYPLAATRFRSDLATVLERLVAEEYISESYGDRVAKGILRDNAIDLYNL